jgi:hypothetical protein
MFKIFRPEMIENTIKFLQRDIGFIIDDTFIKAKFFLIENESAIQYVMIKLILLKVVRPQKKFISKVATLCYGMTIFYWNLQRFRL